jgi:WD40 repeat protein
MIKIWDIDIDVEQKQYMYTGHSDFITSVKFTNDTKVLISASQDRIIKLWDVSTGACTATLEGCGDWVNSIALSHDSKLLASASALDDGTIQLWDIMTGTSIATLEGHENSVGSDTPLLEDGGRRAIRVWRPKDDCYNTVFGWTTSVISAVAFSHNSQLLASASAVDGIIKVWDVGTKTCTATLEGHSMWVNWLAFSHHSNVLASSAGDRNIKVWDIATGVCTAKLEGQSDYDVSPVAISQDSKLLASGLDDGAIKLWDISTGNCITTFPEYDIVISVAFSHNSTLLASVSLPYGKRESVLKFWDISTGQCAATVDVDYCSHENFSFDAVGYSLSTAVGNFTLDGTSSSRTTAAGLLEVTPADLEADPLPRMSNTPVLATDVHVHRRGIGISADLSWVMWNNDRIIWLPPAYRPRKLDAVESTLAIGCSRGQIVLLIVSPDLFNLI